MSISDREARVIYDGRPLAQGHPDIEAHELRAKAAQRDSSLSERSEPVDVILACLGRAISLTETERKVVVVGCGPFPTTVERLSDLGWDCVGVEPVKELASTAREHLGRPAAVLAGSAEDLPLESGSQSLIIMESVLEHVDSPHKALGEAYRVLAPGGALYVGTTNRLQVANAEYTVRFFQWLPRLLKEAYIHQHLHFEPALARYTSRPAVHWYSYADLCALGRIAGFYRFYSKLDLFSIHDSAIQRSALRRAALDRVRFSPWLRSIALTQTGGTIFMLKRSVYVPIGNCWGGVSTRAELPSPSRTPAPRSRRRAGGRSPCIPAGSQWAWRRIHCYSRYSCSQHQGRRGRRTGAGRASRASGCRTEPGGRCYRGPANDTGSDWRARVPAVLWHGMRYCVRLVGSHESVIDEGRGAAGRTAREASS
jgi:ubiquinone/menaquinone biosynthesis C-methylase UbiE